MTVHSNQYFALVDQNHGGEKEWCNYACNYVIRIDIPGNILVCMANWIISCRLGLAEDGDWLGEVAFSDSGYTKFVIHSRTVSLQLEDKNASKYSFKCFPHTRYM